MADEEVKLSIEETNRLRASLGLKPLQAAAAPKPKPQEPKQPKAADPDEIRKKLAETRDKRRREAELRQTRTLGEASPEVDDVASWISKIKPGQAPAAAAPAEQPSDKPSKPSKRQKRSAAAAAAGSDGEGQEHTAADLAGVAVRHDVGDLAEGETVVLTLADTGILDDKGNLADGPDELIDALAVQEKARRRARAAATKTAKPLWEEDGKVRGLLDKYDEEEEEAAAAFDASGQLLAQRQAALHSKLAAGAALLDSTAGSKPSGGGGGGDYYTADEVAATNEGTKGKKKKKRKLRTKVSEADEGEGLDLDALEAAAAAEGAADLGSRQAREGRRQQQEQARVEAAADRAARFGAALGRANIASAALRQTAPGAAAGAGAAGGSSRADPDLDADEADDELAASLARARRLAQKAAGGSSSNGDAAAGAEGGAGAAGGGSSFEEIAKQLAKKRQEDEVRLKEQIASGAVDAFTETTEFVRSIQVAAPKAGDEGTYMDVDEDPAAAAAAAAAAVPTPLPPPPPEVKPPAPKQRNYRKGGWVSADGEEEEQQQDGDGGPAHKRRPAPEFEDTGVVGERAMGKGLAACLGLIKDKGLLKNETKTQWAGRTNDKKPVALIGLEDVYTGGSHEDAMHQRIEVALTQRDEFGRVMTPKERFRVMCHQFHGKPPSKNKQEERQRKYLEEVAVARATSSENPSAELDKLKELQRSTGSAYIPLTGRGKLGGGSGRGEDPLSGLASARSGMAATPVLGGGLTPLSGNKKVEMMLGISKGGSSSGMPPPAPRR